jgi:hypothetical protein
MSTAPTAPPTESTWLDATAAGKLTGLSRRQVVALVERGVIRRLRLPGVRKRLFRPDVEKVARELEAAAKGD